VRSDFGSRLTQAALRRRRQIATAMTSLSRKHPAEGAPLVELSLGGGILGAEGSGLRWQFRGNLGLEPGMSPAFLVAFAAGAAGAPMGSVYGHDLKHLRVEARGAGPHPLMSVEGLALVGIEADVEDLHEMKREWGE
jgi:hypothetical protein